MKNIFGKITKGVKKVMSIPKDICKEIITDRELSLRLGIIITGLGLCLITNAYVKAPQ